MAVACGSDATKSPCDGTGTACIRPARTAPVSSGAGKLWTVTCALRTTRETGHKAKSYQAFQALGRDTHTKVTLALHELTGTKVHIRGVRKSELPDLRLLARYMRCMKALYHPNIVELFQVVDTRQELQLVMEYVQREDLQDFLSECGRLEESEARPIFQQILAALSYCHAKGIAHRDVRPQERCADPRGKSQAGRLRAQRPGLQPGAEHVLLSPRTQGH
ncbi:sperm motility kinase Y-like [Talpa occidentalis]|uniref:sperm motility kinase Y-like n=1 Tax=Talpa occidentalis TaxID=50954 RepID=UPI0023F8925D|nr:sperm motility kinase Y-like [Talpa occidentalis]